MGTGPQLQRLLPLLLVAAAIAANPHSADARSIADASSDMPTVESSVVATGAAHNTSAMGVFARRQLAGSKDSAVMQTLGDAWHNLLIAQYWARQTGCGAKLTQACKLLQAAEGSLKAHQKSQASAQMKQADNMAADCAGNVPSKSQQYIKMASAQIAKTQSMLGVGAQKPAGGGAKKPPAKKGGAPKGTPKKGGSFKKPKAPWLGHNDLPGGVMQWLPYGNPIDDCWMGGNWNNNLQNLANCVEGYATGTTGGKGGRIYHVTTGADHKTNPQPGTLRYGLTRREPLWIVFDGDFTFSQLSAELIVYSDKTIDARGRNIQIGNGPCLAIEFVDNVIVHGIAFKNCKNRGGHTEIMTGPDNTIDGRDYLNGYGVYVYQSHHVWIDHCSFNYADDTHIDVIAGSSMVTISNCYFTNQDKVILMGHNDGNTMDKNMRVTVMLNKFGPNLMERMPRGRFGQFHVLNNYYPNGWGIYAIGGSAAPTFLSEGNYFVGKTEVCTFSQWVKVWGGKGERHLVDFKMKREPRNVRLTNWSWNLERI
eukprot:TRINITY_DN3313_c0_g1_i2.p2 TRINITY_DN3313_c0_g1~~TRINITY_DN3313_c0_g1_i2.p2  ORF type:complete len:537 (-),score=48.05 TRINITY_DN3313_c0_g1_i2:524-2134(-)